MIFEQLYAGDDAARAARGELLCGTDEAGCGPLAGPVCCAAVILPRAARIDGLNDSKKLSEKLRERLFDEILAAALSCSIVFVDSGEIDRVNILNARLQGMSRAVGLLGLRPDFTLVDGNRRPPQENCETLVGGDGKSANIAAASVLAKVSRDRVMRRYDAVYPQYGFAQHKGYPTRLHYERLKEYGPCPIHRQTFLGRLYDEHR